jgi:hypothetical protein
MGGAATRVRCAAPAGGAADVGGGGRGIRYHIRGARGFLHARRTSFSLGTFRFVFAIRFRMNFWCRVRSVKLVIYFVGALTRFVRHRHRARCAGQQARSVD